MKASGICLADMIGEMEADLQIIIPLTGLPVGQITRFGIGRASSLMAMMITGRWTISGSSTIPLRYTFLKTFQLLD